MRSFGGLVVVGDWSWLCPLSFLLIIVAVQDHSVYKGKIWDHVEALVLCGVVLSCVLACI